MSTIEVGKVTCMQRHNTRHDNLSLIHSFQMIHAIRNAANGDCNKQAVGEMLTGDSAPDEG